MPLFHIKIARKIFFPIVFFDPTKCGVGYTRGYGYTRRPLWARITFTAVVLSKRLSFIAGLKSTNLLVCLAGYKVTNQFSSRSTAPNNFQISLLLSRSTMAASFLLSHFSIIAFDTSFADETLDLLYKTTLQIKFYYFLHTQISIALFYNWILDNRHATNCLFHADDNLLLVYKNKWWTLLTRTPFNNEVSKPSTRR